MTERLTTFDPAKYLDSDEAIIGYLQEAFETGDTAFIADAIDVVSRAKGMTQVSNEIGVSEESFCKSLSYEGNPDLGTILKVMSFLGLKLSVSHL